MKITMKVSTGTLHTDEGNKPIFEKKDYFVGEMTMLVVRKSMEIQQLIESKEMDLLKLHPDQLDKLIDFIVVAFGNQFTRDEFYNNFSAKGFVINTMKTVNEIQSKLIDELEKSPE